MRSSDSDIYADEAAYYINWLYSFLGPNNVDRALKRYQRTLKLSGQVVSEYSLRNRHPWWSAFLRYFELKRSAKAIKRNLTAELKILAGDAKKTATLRKYMPLSVQEKYKRDLVDLNRARDYLFEINIAWHFHLQGNDLEWYEDDDQKHPEFLVKTPKFDFNVECKRISVDISRHIDRQDFHRLAQELLPKIEKQGYVGKVDIVLAERLEKKQIDDLTSDILELIRLDKNKGEFTIPFGQVTFKPTEEKERVFNGVQLNENLRKNLSDQTHASIFSSRTDGDLIVDPIALTIKCKKPDNVLDGIFQKVRKAAKNQLDVSIPGLIVCFLEDVYELGDLRSGSGLQLMTFELFDKNTFSHIAAVGYSSEMQAHKIMCGEIYNNQSLVFKNPNCRFKEAKAYDFITPHSIRTVQQPPINIR